MTDPFSPCWARIERAHVHRVAAADAWNAYLDSEPYYCAVDHEGGGHFVAWAIQESPPPDEMAVLIGEWLYNLRAALDYAVYATAICDSGSDPPPGQGQLQFPCYENEKQYRANEYRLKALSDFHRTELIEHMQPFRHDDLDTSAVGWLNRLARIDRHRRLTLVTSYLAELNPVVGVGDCQVATLQRPERAVVEGRAELCRFVVSPWQGDDPGHAQVNPRAGIDPEIAEWSTSPFWKKIRYNDRLRMLDLVVESIVVPLEYGCLGKSRKEGMLTKSFRAASDERRAGIPMA